MFPNLREILDRDFFSKLPNQEKGNSSKLIISFSGLPKSGKSHLSDAIVKKYNSLLIRKDDARTIVYQNYQPESTEEVEEILDDYFEYIKDKIFELPNKLIVVDASVDRRFDYYKRWADKFDYKLFIIEMDTSLDRVKQNIAKIEKEETRRWFLEQIPRWEKDHKDFLKTQKVNFIIKNNSREDIEELFSILDRELK